MKILRSARRSVRRVFLATSCALAFLTVSLLADTVCEGCACNCQGLACGFCVNNVINTCCSGPQPQGCCNATCVSDNLWEVTCERDGMPFWCYVDLGAPCSI